MWLVHGYFDDSWINWQGLLLRLQSGRLLVHYLWLKLLDISVEDIQFAERVQFHRWFPTAAIRIHYADANVTRTVTLGLLFGTRREKLLHLLEEAGVTIR